MLYPLLVKRGLSPLRSFCESAFLLDDGRNIQPKHAVQLSKNQYKNLYSYVVRKKISTQMFIAVLTRAKHWCRFWTRWTQSTSSNCISLKYISLLPITSTHISSKWSISFIFRYLNPVLLSLPFDVCHFPRPSYPAWFNHPNNANIVRQNAIISIFSINRLLLPS